MPAAQRPVRKSVFAETDVTTTFPSPIARMEIAFVDRQHLLDRDTRQFAERRLLYALARFDDRITRVLVTVEDVNGPRGGVDKASRITVRLRRLEEVTVRGQHESLHACLARSAQRVGHAVSRALDKRQQFDRDESSTSWPEEQKPPPARSAVGLSPGPGSGSRA